MNCLFETPSYACKPLEELVLKGVRWSGRVLNKHVDIIGNVGILAITTCLLAGKVFDNIPKVLPRIARVVYDFGGIIWLNAQVRDLIKSGRDFGRAFLEKDIPGVVEVATKVFVKGVNVFFTVAIFGGSIIAACGFPQASLALALAIRPLGLASLALNILLDVRDYSMNERLLKQFSSYEEDSEFSLSVAKTVASFAEIILGRELSRGWEEQRRFADLLVRHLDTLTIETFQELLAKDRERIQPRSEALKIFYSIKDGMRSRQAGTKANLSLTAMAYISRGICRAFPDTLIDMTTRWSISVLWTDEFIRQKLFQYDLATE